MAQMADLEGMYTSHATAFPVSVLYDHILTSVRYSTMKFVLETQQLLVTVAQVAMVVMVVTAVRLFHFSILSVAYFA